MLWEDKILHHLLFLPNIRKMQILQKPWKIFAINCTQRCITKKMWSLKDFRFFCETRFAFNFNKSRREPSIPMLSNFEEEARQKACFLLRMFQNLPRVHWWHIFAKLCHQRITLSLKLDCWRFHQSSEKIRSN